MNQLSESSGFVYFYDLGVQTAVDMFNQANSSILPNVHINIKRFSDCGEYWPSVSKDYSGKSGGFAGAIMSEDVLANTDVIGVIGIEYSTVARQSGEVLSNYKIPTCSPASGSPSLTNRGNYPYFWRTLLSIGFGEHLYQVLAKWNVHRIALIYQVDDNLGYQYGLDIIKSMNVHGIQIVAQIALPTTFDRAGLLYTKTEITRADARYIVVSGQASYVGDVYHNMGTLDLVNPKYVWISYNGIQPPSNNTYAEGFIFMPISLPDFSLPLIQKAQSQFEKTSQTTPEQLSFKDMVAFWGLGQAIDCVNMMLTGFNNLLGQHPAFTVEMLASRQLQNHLNFTLFQNTGYNGIMASPALLNQYGDLKSSFDTMYYTGNGYQAISFGKTSIDASSFNYFSAPVFRGGSSTPPPDGPPQSLATLFNPTFSIYPGSIVTIYIVVTTTLGLANAAGCLYFQNKKTIKRSSLTFLLNTSLGLILLSLSLIFLLGQPTVLSCHAVIWMQVLGYNVIISGLCAKSYFDYILVVLRKKNMINLKVTRAAFHVLPAVLEILLLFLWSYFGSHTVKQVTTTTYIANTCSGSGYSSIYGILLTVYNVLLFIATSYMAFVTREAEVLNNETVFPSLVVTAFGFTTIVALPLLSVTEPGPQQLLIHSTSICFLVVFTVCAVGGPKVISIMADKKRINNELREIMKPKRNSNVLAKIRSRSSSFIESEMAKTTKERPMSVDTHSLRYSSTPSSRSQNSHYGALKPKLLEEAKPKVVQLAVLCWQERRGSWRLGIISTWSCRTQKWILVESDKYARPILIPGLKFSGVVENGVHKLVLKCAKGSLIIMEFDDQVQLDKCQAAIQQEIALTDRNCLNQGLVSIAEGK
ncbi:periplasmic binding protein-like I [Obelidium mucronatum]|nr:periplasmic binding protein-like I [Obelidium mucronatum]